MPRHLADDSLSEAGSARALPRLDGFDLAAVAVNVDRLGGDSRRFARNFGAAVEHAGAAADPDTTRAAIALAAWRSGVLALRDEALGRLRGLAADAGSRAVAAAALGLDADTVPEFAARQEADRFWWPERVRWNGYVCAVGGFAGVGGAWIEPPTDGRALAPLRDAPDSRFPVAVAETAVPATFAVRTGATWWRIDADVWGSRVTRTGDTPAPSAAPKAGRVSVVTRPDSYLAWVHVRDDA